MADMYQSVCLVYGSHRDLREYTSAVYKNERHVSYIVQILRHVFLSPLFHDALKRQRQQAVLVHNSNRDGAASLGRAAGASGDVLDGRRVPAPVAESGHGARGCKRVKCRTVGAGLRYLRTNY